MELTEAQKQAISILKNRLVGIQGVNQIRDDLFKIMTLDWIDNASPNEPGIETPFQMKELIEDQFPDVQLGNQDALEILDAWLDFVSAFYAANGGKRRKRSRRTRKHKKRSKKTRKHYMKS